MAIAARPVVPITWLEFVQIQGASNLPTRPQPCTPIQAFLLKCELSSHPGYAIVTQNACYGQFLHLPFMNFRANELKPNLNWSGIMLQSN